MATVRLRGGPTLSYREWGRPDGSVVLLLHGLTSSSDSWRNVAPVLGERFRVIALDARGHGDSDHTSDYSFEAMRDDVVGALEALGVLAAIVVGHSMGALTAYLLAATHPDLIRLLVLDEMPPPDAAKPLLALPRSSHPDDTCDWRSVIAVRRWRNDPPRAWWDLAAQITARTLVLGGRHSHLNQTRMQEVAHRLPQGTYAGLDYGHNIHAEQPSAWLQQVEPFIAWFGK